MLIQSLVWPFENVLLAFVRIHVDNDLYHIIMLLRNYRDQVKDNIFFLYCKS